MLDRHCRRLRLLSKLILMLQEEFRRMMGSWERCLPCCMVLEICPVVEALVWKKSEDLDSEVLDRPLVLLPLPGDSRLLREASHHHHPVEEAHHLFGVLRHSGDHLGPHSGA